MRVSRRVLALLATAIVAGQALLVLVAVSTAPSVADDARVLAWSWLLVPLLGLTAYLSLRPALLALAGCALLHLVLLPDLPTLGPLVVGAGAVLLARLVALAARREEPGH